MHDPTKVLLGTTGSSDRDVSVENANPATFPAGLAVRKKSDGGLSVNSGDGALIGVSAGRSLSDTERTAVIRTGLRVPLQLTDEGVQASLEQGDLTFTAVLKGAEGNNITIAFVDDATAGSETVDVEGQDIVVHMESGVSTAQQIVDALEASVEASALISVEVSGSNDPQAAFAEDNLEGGKDSFSYVELGAAVEVDDNGKAVSESGSATGAIFVSGPMKGVDPITKSEVDVALIDMPGGL